MGHILEHVALEIQSLAGCEVTFGKTRSADQQGVYHVVYEYEEEWVGAYAGDLSLRLLHDLLPEHLIGSAKKEPDFDFNKEMETFIRRAERRAFGPSTASLVRAAEKRGIHDRSIWGKF